MEKAVNVGHSSATDDVSKYVNMRGPLVGSRVRDALIACEHEAARTTDDNRKEAPVVDPVQQSISEVINGLPVPEELSSAHETGQTEEAFNTDLPAPETALPLDTKTLTVEAAKLSSEHELSQRRRLTDARLELAKSWVDQAEDDSVPAAEYKGALEAIHGQSWMEDEALHLSIIESEKGRLQTAAASYRALQTLEEPKSRRRNSPRLSTRQQKTAAILVVVASAGAGASANNQQEQPAVKQQAAAIVDSLEPTTTTALYAELPVLPPTSTTIAPTTTTTQPPTTTTIPPAPTTTHTHLPAVESGAAQGAGWDALRECEAGGNYGANTGNGYYGAYQFDQRTWNGVARNSGRDDLVGVSPDQASPSDQDAMAQELYDDRGPQPWPVCGQNL